METILDDIKFEDLDQDAPALCRYIDQVVDHIFTEAVSIPDMNGAEDMARQAARDHCLALARDNEDHLVCQGPDDKILYRIYEVVEAGMSFVNGYVKGYNEANNGCRC